MGLETIAPEDLPDSLNPAWPASNDNLKEGDDHLRNIKITLINLYNVVQALDKEDIGLSEVPNYGLTTDISAGESDKLVTAADVASVLQGPYQATTGATVEAALANVPVNGLVSNVEVIVQGSSYRATYYKVNAYAAP